MLLSPQEGQPSSHQVYILPPSPSTSVHPPVPLVLQIPPLDIDGFPPSFARAAQDSEKLEVEALPELLDRLDLDSVDSLRKYTKKILHEMVDICRVGIQGQSRDNVQLQLDLLDDQWREDRLSEMAKAKLGSPACALKNDDLKQADRLHLSLMVDHITEVSQWMVGVKRIIYELKHLQSSSQSSTSKKSFKKHGTTVATNSLDTNGHYNNT